MPSKSKAKDRIKKALDQIPELMKMDSGSQDFIKWQRSTRIAITNTFAESGGHLKEFNNISFTPFLLEAEFFQGAYEDGLARSKATLESMLEEIDEYWADDDLIQLPTERTNSTNQTSSRKVFVVHGRDEGTKNIVARLLESLNLEPVILQDQPNEGRTIIEKFEEYSQATFAVILCTPDDVGAIATKQESLNPRPRQNVVLEWGFFLGRIGRERVCALIKGDVEIPSDYAGVVYIDLDESGGWKMKLARELTEAGFPVDLNLLLRR